MRTGRIGKRNGVLRLFARRFLRDPKAIGAICPSSRFLARKIVHSVDWKPGVKVVEFGPGTGPFTDEILRLMPAEGRHLAIERDPVFVDLLRDRFPRLEVSCDGVENLMDIAGERALLPVDHIISGLPFASLGTELTKRILAGARQALRPGGTFTTFQYVHAYGFTAARSFRREMRRHFGPIAKRCVEFRNVPPAFVFTWRKPHPNHDAD